MASIPFCDVQRDVKEFRLAVAQGIDAVLDSGAFILGPQVAECEEGLCKYSGAKHCITVSNGTDALRLALMAARVGSVGSEGREGSELDEVITVPFTWISTAEVIPLVGAVPVFVDIDPATMNICPAAVEAAITPRTKAIIAVSLFGRMAPMEELMSIAARYNVVVIEDGAQSFGAMLNGRKSCSVAHLSTTSFFPSKPFGGYGDGGAVFTNDDRIASKLAALRNHGAHERHTHIYIGDNARMNTLQAAVLLAKLARIDEIMSRREHAGRRYDSLLFECTPALALPAPIAGGGSRHVYAQYTLRCTGVSRQAIQSVLNSAGVPTAVYYPVPCHLQACFARFGYKAGDFPHSEAASEQVLSLPMHTFITPAEQERVAAAVRSAVLGNRPRSLSIAKDHRVAVIGAGYWGLNHIKTLARMGCLGSVCDTSPDRLAMVHQLFGVPTFSSMDAMLAEGTFTCVTVATPVSTHVPIATKVLQRGYSVLIEKPLASSLDEVACLQRAAEEAGRVVLVGHLLRYHPCLERMLDLIEAGTIGTVRRIEAIRKSLGKFYDGVSVLWDYGPHDISTVLALVPGKVASVRATGTATLSRADTDVASLHLEFASGVQASIHLDRTYPTKEFRTTVIGDRGTIVFNDTAAEWNERLCLYPAMTTDPSEAPSLAVKTSIFEYMKSGKYISTPQELPLDKEYRHFFDCLDSKAVPRTDISESVRVLSIILEAEEQIAPPKA